MDLPWRDAPQGDIEENGVAEEGISAYAESMQQSLLNQTVTITERRTGIRHSLGSHRRRGVPGNGAPVSKEDSAAFVTRPQKVWKREVGLSGGGW